ERVPRVEVCELVLRALVDTVRERRLFRIAVDRPALVTAVSLGLRIRRRFALGPIESGEVSAHAPALIHHAVSSGFDAARANQLGFLAERRLEEFGLAGLRRVRSFLERGGTLVAACAARR